jgi:hypothetical protein
VFGAFKSCAGALSTFSNLSAGSCLLIVPSSFLVVFSCRVVVFTCHIYLFSFCFIFCNNLNFFVVFMFGYVDY